jgi:hypothetical protein
MEISEETLALKVTWEVKALKETEGSLGHQVSLDSWATLVQKDQRDKKAAWEILAWKDPWAREGEKAPWDLVVNQGLLDLERKGTEELLVLRVLPASQVLWVPKVPVVLLAPTVPQALWVSKGSEVKWDFLVSKVTKDLWDHQDPKVTMVRKDPEASQASLA